jgi:hypothetical protein
MSVLWGFGGSAWSAVAALMRLADGDGHVGGLGMAVRIAMRPLKTGRFRRCRWYGTRDQPETHDRVGPPTIRALGGYAER